MFKTQLNCAPYVAPSDLKEIQHLVRAFGVPPVPPGLFLLGSLSLGPPLPMVNGLFGGGLNILKMCLLRCFFQKFREIDYAILLVFYYRSFFLFTNSGKGFVTLLTYYGKMVTYKHFCGQEIF